jgi:hypothetical protein
MMGAPKEETIYENRVSGTVETGSGDGRAEIVLYACNWGT